MPQVPRLNYVLPWRQVSELPSSATRRSTPMVPASDRTNLEASMSVLRPRTKPCLRMSLQAGTQTLRHS